MTLSERFSLLTRLPLSREAFLVLCIAAAFRIVHLVSALRSPLSHQIGPDEDYYLRFAQDVAFGSGGFSPEFTFMDPLYGYLLGLIHLVPGGGSALMYICQIAVDSLTAVGLLVLGRMLDRPKVGVTAGLIYCALGPAMAFSTSLLKTTWVTAYVCWWMVLALNTLSASTWRRWFWFGLYSGIGVALRANLILLAPLAMIALWWLRQETPLDRKGSRPVVVLAACMAAGLLLPLMTLAVRNIIVDGRYSPVPTNGGVVLHQLYHPENPESRSPGLPSFVAYAHPSEIWRGYQAEAERRAGHSLDATARDAYWRAQGRDYLLSNPVQSFSNGLRKLAEFTAYTEVPNNRSYEDERRFSPLLRWLPQPFGWLFALGLPGLILLTFLDRRGWIVLAPVAMGLVTIAVFFAEDRFRFNIVAPFVFGSAFWICWCWDKLRANAYRPLALAVVASATLGAWSVWQAARLPDFPGDWQRVATGYFKQGDYRSLQALLREVEERDSEAIGISEFNGLLALTRGDYPAANAFYEDALSKRSNRHEVWHNYAIVLDALGYADDALTAQAIAYQIHPTAEYAFKLGGYLERLGRLDEAADVYKSLASDDSPWSSKAKARFDSLHPE